MIDPPWRWSARGKNGDAKAPPYKTQPLEWLKGLEIPDLLDPTGAAVGLWVVDPMLPQALELATAWKLRFSSVLFYWAKTNPRHAAFGAASSSSTWHMGTGYGTRANPEQCWLFFYGRGLKRQAADVRRLIVEPVGAHSAKPDVAYARVERLFGDVPRADIFARRLREGWAVWGNEIACDFEIEGAQ
jgi:N6-adenosine-specific RNA methylase IME4